MAIVSYGRVNLVLIMHDYRGTPIIPDNKCLSGRFLGPMNRL